MKINPFIIILLVFPLLFSCDSTKRKYANGYVAKNQTHKNDTESYSSQSKTNERSNEQNEFKESKSGNSSSNEYKKGVSEFEESSNSNESTPSVSPKPSSTIKSQNESNNHSYTDKDPIELNTTSTDRKEQSPNEGEGNYRNSFSWLSLLFGILGVVVAIISIIIAILINDWGSIGVLIIGGVFTFVFAALAIIFGAINIKKLTKEDKKARQDPLALSGLIIGASLLAVIFSVILFFFVK